MRKRLHLRLHQCHLENLGLHTYSFRHGGPSHDRAIKFRSLGDIQKRGRWASPASVRRYEKAGRVQKTVNAAARTARAYAQAAVRQLYGVLQGVKRPLRPPRA